MDHILQFFTYAHLPAALQAVSAPFGNLAHHIVTTLPRNPERTVALRKLLEAKDAAVRAVVAQEAPRREHPDVCTDDRPGADCVDQHHPACRYGHTR